MILLEQPMLRTAPLRRHPERQADFHPLRPFAQTGAGEDEAYRLWAIKQRRR
jgi:hypothetical protein